MIPELLGLMVIVYQVDVLRLIAKGSLGVYNVTCKIVANLTLGQPPKKNISMTHELFFCYQTSQVCMIYILRL